MKNKTDRKLLEFALNQTNGRHMVKISEKTEENPYIDLQLIARFKEGHQNCRKRH